jgi:hypothetical protein
MALGNKVFAKLRIVFGHTDQIGSVIDADQKNTHSIQILNDNSYPKLETAKHHRIGSTASAERSLSQRPIAA